MYTAEGAQKELPCGPHTQRSIEHFYLPRKYPCLYLPGLSVSCQETTVPSFACFRTSQKWNRTLYILCIQLLLFSNMFVRCIHVAFLHFADWYSIVRIYQFVHSVLLITNIWILSSFCFYAISIYAQALNGLIFPFLLDKYL